MARALSAIKGVSRGDLSVRTGQHGSDEVGQMLKATDEMVHMLERFSRETREMIRLHEAEDITHRIAGIPAYLDGMLARLDRPVERWVEMDVAKVIELPSLLASMQSWAHEARWSGSNWLGEVSRPAVAALEAYAERLRALPTSPRFQVGAAAAARLLESQLYEIAPLDPISYAIAGLVLAAAALTACGLPAARAATAPPMTVLKDE